MSKIKYVTESILHSYSKVFFAENKFLGLILLLVSFFDYWAGIVGIVAVLTVILTAKTMKFNAEFVRNGAYGFNSLLIGLGVGLYFQPSFYSLILGVLASLLGFFITLAVAGFFTKYALPFLSIPFLLGMWIVAASFSDLDTFGLSDRGIYSLNDYYAVSGVWFIHIYEWFNSLQIPDFWTSYFLSLGAIFFQFNILAGILIALGLLIYSRIAFSFSLLGFTIAYFFYHLLGLTTETITYSYVGFNFILTSVAIGAFYLLPTRATYLWMFILLPITVLITVAAKKILSPLYLPIYSLPFNMVVLLFLYILKLRTEYSAGLREPAIQRASPEANLYYYQNSKERFFTDNYLPVFLPVIGDWTIAQGHNGEHTHKGEWQHAWDFVVVDENQSQYSEKGDFTQDYYCFAKNVYASAEGEVIEILNGVDDNKIGEVNMVHNWGNTVLIRHSMYLYSKYSHLKKDAIKVVKGEFVAKGQVLGQVGNSGRSPYPHLHFQFQANPYIGSPTLEYPFAYYISKEGTKNIVEKFAIPNENQLISNTLNNFVLEKALKFTPGQSIKVQSGDKQLTWQVATTAYNQPYLFCSETNSFAYFTTEDYRLFFADFEGDKDSLLFKFFITFYQIHWSYIDKLQIHDSIPVNLIIPPYKLWFYDFIAAFKDWLKINYQLKYTHFEDNLTDAKVNLEVKINSKRKIYSNSEIILYQNGNIEWKLEGKSTILITND